MPCRLFHKSIPRIVSDDEKLVRFILSPLHVKNGRLKGNAYNVGKGSDEISVTRLDYSSPEKCKVLAKDMQNPKGSYCGFGLHYKHEVMECGAVDVRRAPNRNNPAHANIIACMVRPDDDNDLPAELLLLKDKLVESCRFFMDSDPDNDKWTGLPLE